MIDNALKGRERMELQEIEVYIDKDGTVRIEVRGAKGNSCLELTKGLEKALGGQVEAREMTPEAGTEIQQAEERQRIEGS
jgi:hypothetical protein